MKISVNFEDSVIVCQGLSFSAKGRLSSPNPNYRVLQWAETSGWIEVYNGDRIWLTADDEAVIQPYVQLHTDLGNELIEKARADAEAVEAARAAARAEAQVTPASNPST